MKYNYVIFQTADDYFRISQQDYLKMENVKYIDQFPYKACKFVRNIYRAHFSDKINRLIEIPLGREIPLRSLWNPYYFNESFKDGSPIVFVFCGRYAFWAKYGLIDFLKNKYPGSKYVCYFQDIISDHKRITIDEVKKAFDMVITYDQADAEKYKLEYHPTIFSQVHVDEDPSIPSCDVYFVGAAKNRLDDIYKAYNKLSDIGFRCDFYIINALPDKQLNKDGLHYIKHMDYYTNLQHVLKCKGILEILQKGAVGASLRMKEALIFNKYFFSNMPMQPHVESEIESSRYLCVYNSSSVSDIIKHPLPYNKDLVSNISAQHFLDFISKNI